MTQIDFGARQAWREPTIKIPQIPTWRGSVGHGLFNTGPLLPFNIGAKIQPGRLGTWVRSVEWLLHLFAACVALVAPSCIDDVVKCDSEGLL